MRAILLYCRPPLRGAGIGLTHFALQMSGAPAHMMGSVVSCDDGSCRAMSVRDLRNLDAIRLLQRWTWLRCLAVGLSRAVANRGCPSRALCAFECLTELPYLVLSLEY